MSLLMIRCARCALLHDIDPPESTADGWIVVGDRIVCPGCATPHDKMHSPSVADFARAELLRRFRERTR